MNYNSVAFILSACVDIITRFCGRHGRVAMYFCVGGVHPYWLLGTGTYLATNRR